MGFFLMTQASFIKYFVGKESVPSITISTSEISPKTFFFVIGAFVKQTSVKGALFFINSDKTAALDLPVLGRIADRALRRSHVQPRRVITVAWKEWN